MTLKNIDETVDLFTLIHVVNKNGLFNITFLFNWLVNNPKCRLYILNKSENATFELFAMYIKSYANHECK